MGLIILSIPIFFILIGLELIYQLATKKKLYRFNDAVSNINCGIAQQITNIFTKSLLLVTYLWVYENWRWFTIKDTWYTYIILLLLVDFFYYLYHRYAHEIALFWGSHVVHHQSEDYNLSVALRQSSLQTFVSAWFYLPLAFIGFSFTSFLVIASIQTLYQFWIHTEVIRKLPAWFEFIFNTPSHHRVHHSSDPKYIDKNHGGTFIIWDRLFGTFKEEEDSINYGVTKPVQSWNTIWVNIEYYKWLWEVFKSSKGVDKLKVLFNKTGWRPEYLGGMLVPENRPANYQKYDANSSQKYNLYALVLFIFLLACTSLFLFNAEHLGVTNNLIYTALLLWMMINIGGILENKTWSKWSELARIALTFITFLLINNGSEMWIKISASILSAAFFMIYLTFIYLEQSHKNTNLA